MAQGRTFFLLVSLFLLIFVYCSHTTFGESDHTGGSGTGSGESTARRSAGATTLSEASASVLAKVFHLPKDFVKQRYDSKIPKALDAATEKDEGPIAKIVAELFGTINQKQLESLIAAVKREKQAEEKKTPRDEKHLDLMERLLVAAEHLKDEDFTPSDEEGVRFLDAFKGEFETVKQSNAEFYEKLKQALNGNEAAKEFLRTNYDPRALLSFMDAQRKSGKEELARNIAKSISFKEASGNHNLEMTGSGGRKERLELGKSDQDIDFALDKFSSGPGFGSRSVARARPDRPDETFRFRRPTAQQAEKEEKTAAPPEKENPVDQPAPPQKEEPPPANTGNGGNTPPSSEAAALAIIQAKCARCHGPGKRQAGKLEDGYIEFDAQGRPLEGKAAIERIIARAAIGDDSDMPPSGPPLSAEQQAILRRWAEENGVRPE